MNTVLTIKGIRLDICNQKINPKCVLLVHTVILKRPLCLYRKFTQFYAEATSFLEIPFYIWNFYFLACTKVLKKGSDQKFIFSFFGNIYFGVL